VELYRPTHHILWRDAQAQEHLFLLPLIVIVLSQLQVHDVDKIGKENKYRKIGNVVRNRNSMEVYKNSIWRFTDRNSNHKPVLGDDSNSTKCLQPAGKILGARLLVSFCGSEKASNYDLKTLRTKH
jgi:hypothetical protein